MSARRIQFCSGGNKLPDFENRDMDCDITQRLPYDDASIGFVLIEHGLEHVNCAHGLRFLDEAHRILKPGGIIRVCVPVLERIADMHHARDLCLGHGHQNLYCKQTLTQMLWCAGFTNIRDTGRKDCDGHWRAIGIEKDDLETLRMEGTK